jgi:hypothetical protein
MDLKKLKFLNLESYHPLKFDEKDLNIIKILEENGCKVNL